MLALALGVGFSPGPSPTGIPAGAIGGKMTLAAGTGASMPAPCDGCADEGSANEYVCMVACVGAGPAILPATAVVVMPRPAAFTAPAPLGGSGRLGPPDPYPPRSSALG